MISESGRAGRRYYRFALFVLALNLTVILWGALVRATGSGAGCGSHWPLCNGEVIPLLAAQATLIEFTHRLLSGLALIAVGVLWAWTLRRFDRGDPIRRWSWGALALVFVEALVGAGLVLMRWVADDVSAGRAVSIAVHLVITYGLLACLGMVAWYAAGPRLGTPAGHQPAWIQAALIAGMLAVGASGAITALGDTLFPAETLVKGLADDLAYGAHWLIRLRVIHPILAVGVAAGTLIWSERRGRSAPLRGSAARRWHLALRWVLLAQLAAGLMNVALLAPVWMQIVHLALADAAWLMLVVCLAEFRRDSSRAPSTP